jgi:hypothetical protein
MGDMDKLKVSQALELDTVAILLLEKQKSCSAMLDCGVDPHDEIMAIPSKEFVAFEVLLWYMMNYPTPALEVAQVRETAANYLRERGVI